MTPIVALWLFSLFAAALWSRRHVESVLPLDAWGRTVKRRALGATWAAWTLLLLVHVHFWYTEHRFGLGWLLPMVLLLSTRWVRRELLVWGLVSGTLLLVAVELPATLSLSALMAAGVLCLRAYRQPQSVTFVTAPPPNGPYRAAVDPSATSRRTATCFVPARRRALAPRRGSADVRISCDLGSRLVGRRMAHACDRARRAFLGSSRCCCPEGAPLAVASASVGKLLPRSIFERDHSCAPDCPRMGHLGNRAWIRSAAGVAVDQLSPASG